MWGGAGLGPVVAGATATWLPVPTVVCYLLEVALVPMAISAVAGTRPAHPTGQVPDTTTADRGAIARVAPGASGTQKWQLVGIGAHLAGVGRLTSSGEQGCTHRVAVDAGRTAGAPP